MPAAEVNELETDQAVIEEFAVLKANRSRRQALEELDDGDYQAAEGTLGNVYASLSSLKPSHRLKRELQLINEKKAMLKTNRNRTRKGLRRESLRSSLDVWEADESKQS
jgi:Ca-activated chloride channel family protein